MDETNRVLLTVAFRHGAYAEGAVETVTAHGGRLLGHADGALVSMFPDIAAATTCAERLRERETWADRVVVNVGPVGDVSPPLVGRGVDRALSLLAALKTGEIAVSAVADSRVVHTISRSTIAHDGAEDPRAGLLAALQWGGLLAYGAFWFGLIAWRIWYYAEKGHYPCWPDFLCG